MKEKAIIPHRGVIALDIIDSLKSAGLETVLLHSPEDADSLPVKLADRCFKFYSSRLEDSYMDMEAIIDRALEVGARYIHPGYGFLSEEPDFARLCEENHIKFIGPGVDTLRAVGDKTRMRSIARGLDIQVVPHSELIKTLSDFDRLAPGFQFPVLIKPLCGSGGKGIRAAEYKKDAREGIEKMLQGEIYRKQGVFLDDYFPFGHHIEIPFFRDRGGNILFPPEIESSIQRRFQKVFQESPSINISAGLRLSLYRDAQKLIEAVDYIGLGYVEFIVEKGAAYFSEINPSFQINALVPEIHLISNFLKKQFAICNDGLLHGVEGVKIIEPRYHVLLVSLMAENPFDRFQPSSGTVTEFYNYSTIRNIFKTYLYRGARVSPLYDPYVGKIATFSSRRDHSIKDMRNFLSNIIIKGIRTNLPLLRYLLNSKALVDGETIIDFLNLKCDFSRREKSEEGVAIAAALLAAAFHIESKDNDYKARLAEMKQPGFFNRLFHRM
jgi:acetyl/propionyl-CoA carboxylase alpha subunit